MLALMSLSEGVSYNPSSVVAWLMVVLALGSAAAVYFWQKQRRP